MKEAEDELEEVKQHHSQVLKNHSKEIETLMSRHSDEVSRLVARTEEFRQQCIAEREKVPWTLRSLPYRVLFTPVFFFCVSLKGMEIEKKTESMIKEAKKSFDEEVKRAVENHAETLAQLENQIETAQETLEKKETEIAKLSIEVEELKNCSATKVT